MRFSKWHALGNSYLVVDRAETGSELDTEQVRRLCDTGHGVGAHGVLEVVAADQERAEIVIWNPDGSTSEMSGNGTRIAARWLAARSGADRVVVAVGSRKVDARMREDGLVETDVGAFEVGEEETLDVHGNPVELRAVSVGNPHAVVECEEPDREVLLRLGPLIETHGRFPGRTNVQFVHADGPHDARALVWERGAGETPSSGSSAVAVAAALVAAGACTSPVMVRMPGGSLEVRLENGRATLIGPAEEICHGEVLM
jgi:diaminopimelate epimerase